MPANLTPQYKEAERRFKEAKTSEEKLAALREMMAIIPKHKGTEKLQADLKHRLSKLSGQVEQEKRAHGGHGVPDHVDREGAGQIVLAGAPNSGRSSLLAALTRAHPEIASYPFTTHRPQPGMMEIEDIQIQLVDTPPFSPEFTEPWLSNLFRPADAIWLVADLGETDPSAGLSYVVEALTAARIDLARGRPASPLPAPIDPRNQVKKTVLLANKSDLPEAGARLEDLRTLWSERFDVFPVSALHHTGLEDLRRETFLLLDLVRVYPKEPGKKPDLHAPYVLARGSTVLDLAARIHKDLATHFDFARLWRSEHEGGIRVSRDHVLVDREIVEIHARA